MSTPASSGDQQPRPRSPTRVRRPPPRDGAPPAGPEPGARRRAGSAPSSRKRAPGCRPGGGARDGAGARRCRCRRWVGGTVHVVEHDGRRPPPAAECRRECPRRAAPHPPTPARDASHGGFDVRHQLDVSRGVLGEGARPRVTTVSRGGTPRPRTGSSSDGTRRTRSSSDRCAGRSSPTSGRRRPVAARRRGGAGRPLRRQPGAGGDEPSSPSPRHQKPRPCRNTLRTPPSGTRTVTRATSASSMVPTLAASAASTVPRSAAAPAPGRRRRRRQACSTTLSLPCTAHAEVPAGAVPPRRSRRSTLWPVWISTPLARARRRDVPRAATSPPEG